MTRGLDRLVAYSLLERINDLSFMGAMALFSVHHCSDVSKIDSRFGQTFRHRDTSVVLMDE